MTVTTFRELETMDYQVTLSRDEIRSICATMTERSGFWQRTADAEDSSDPETFHRLSLKCLAIAERMAQILDAHL